MVGLPARQADRAEELKGPRVGAPEQALAGFLRKTGLGQEALVDRDGVWFATIARAGRHTAEVIAETAVTRISERGATRADDRFSEAAMEDRKKEGYF